jgi:hypothetical protein
MVLPLVAFVLACCVLVLINRDDLAAAAPAPAETVFKDWPVYIPETPQVCRDAMEAAEDMADRSVALHDVDMKRSAVIVQAQQAKDPKVSLQKLAEAKRLIRASERANRELAAAEKAYSELAEKCRKV